MGSRLEENSKAVRKRIESHAFDNEEGEEYGGSSFGGFGDYFRRKKIKLQNLDAEIRSQTKGNPAIFRGVVAHVNGYTQPSLNDLHKLIVSHGGGFLQYLDGKTMVTHIIASNLTAKKAVEFKRYRIVKPAWVVDSVKAGRMLPWNDYRVVNEGPAQKTLGFNNGRMVNQAGARPSGYREQSDASWYTAQLKEGKAAANAYDASTTVGRDEDLSPSFFSSSPLSHHTASMQGREQGRAVNELQNDKNYKSDLISKDKKEEFPESRLPTASDQLYDEGIEFLDGMALDEDTNSDEQEMIEHNVPQPPVPPKESDLTAEEHNAILLADPKIWKSTVVNPAFLEQYYRESRLHHLSAWKADLKAQLQALAAEKTSSQKALQKRPLGSRRYILHVDFDSFFAAVSLKKAPQYRDKPAVVAHGNGSGSEIASCNYPARKFGIKNGMWMKRAQELCPELKILPYDFPAYEDASRAFYDAILSVDGVVQSVSVDEALIDISKICIAHSGSDGIKRNEGSIYREQARADEVAQELRDQIKKKTDCDVSVGIGGNILLAKIALRKAKPAGQYQIRPDEVLDFIGGLEVQDLPGVAWSTAGKLEEIGIKYVRDIREVSKERLVSAMGPKTGQKLWEYARGIDKAEVGEQVVRKSVSAEVNWGVRFVTQDQVDDFIQSLCGELRKRLLKERVKGRQFTMKIMRRSPDAPLDPPKHLGHGKCDTYNKSISLGVSTNDADVLTKEALSVLKGFGFPPGELRGIGVQMTKLEPVKDGRADGSQRRLQFKLAEPAKPVGLKAPDTSKPVTGPETPRSQRQLPVKHLELTPKSSPEKASPGTQRRLQFKPVPRNNKADIPEGDDPIKDDADTPQKRHPSSSPTPIHPGSHQLLEDTPRKRPLNTLGTQFIVPTQVDPQVLAELPADIRAKLSRHVRPSSPTPAPRAGPSTKQSQNTLNILTALPNPSQLDPEALAALPEDIRAEILAHYDNMPANLQTQEPKKEVWSPSKNRIMPPSKQTPVPFMGRKRGRPKGSKNLKTIRALDSEPTLTQSNFVTSRIADGFGVGKMDEEVLAALPPDLREEVLAQQQREREQLLNRQGRRARRPIPAVPTGLVTFVLPPRPPKPTFTMQGLHTLEELRESIKAWWEEFKEDGPYDEDIAALCNYVDSVVKEERDTSKATSLVKWVEWTVDEGLSSQDWIENGTQGGEAKWIETVRKVKDAVQRAVGQRRLGKLAF